PRGTFLPSKRCWPKPTIPSESLTRSALCVPIPASRRKISPATRARVALENARFARALHFFTDLSHSSCDHSNCEFIQPKCSGSTRVILFSLDSSYPMWIVALALRRPYTFVVMALVIILLFPLTLYRTPVDIFPEINIPVISVVWNFTGMSPNDMAQRIVTNSERGMTVTVNDIEHIESQSIYGVGVIKVFFRPGANIQTALSQITAIVQTTVRGLPPGATPPLVITYNASTTPIIQLGLSSRTLPEQQLF